MGEDLRLKLINTAYCKINVIFMHVYLIIKLCLSSSPEYKIAIDNYKFLVKHVMPEVQNSGSGNQSYRFFGSLLQQTVRQ